MIAKPLSDARSVSLQLFVRFFVQNALSLCIFWTTEIVWIFGGCFSPSDGPIVRCFDDDSNDFCLAYIWYVPFLLLSRQIASFAVDLCSGVQLFQQLFLQLWYCSFFLWRTFLVPLNFLTSLICVIAKNPSIRGDCWTCLFHFCSSSLSHTISRYCETWCYSSAVL